MSFGGIVVDLKILVSEAQCYARARTGLIIAGAKVRQEFTFGWRRYFLLPRWAPSPGPAAFSTSYEHWARPSSFCSVREGELR